MPRGVKGGERLKKEKDREEKVFLDQACVLSLPHQLLSLATLPLCFAAFASHFLCGAEKKKKVEKKKKN